MNRTKPIVAALLAGMLVLSVLAPVGAAATTDDSTDLTIDVSDEEDPVVTVTHNDSAVENATVDVAIDENETDENASYDGVGTYTTDENGTVDLPAPSEAVTVVITATAENASATTTVELGPSDNESENAFGQLLSSFIEDTDKSEVDGPFGQFVADFVHENNPGNAPDHAGPPADAGGDNESSQGPPAHAGNDDGEDDDEKRGPPSNAGGPDDADDGDGEDEATDDEDTADDETDA
ncbi:hypothetical protein Halru_0243 [Halovivax ruber XH-70]|uniref:Uncharacterized protein n=1 Tax=Halovivax ruber (strain DSM 18193 / JCM 13892 / XH-70) TaxID=797302 RepID=L0I876_HALRX|nr:hypothetical protein [Halovivax ruber]AGB14889.1 hypothetical protein Halru_0243 [Halovivax ruber XH-70]